MRGQVFQLHAGCAKAAIGTVYKTLSKCSIFVFLQPYKLNGFEVWIGTGYYNGTVWFIYYLSKESLLVSDWLFTSVDSSIIYELSVDDFLHFVKETAS